MRKNNTMLNSIEAPPPSSPLKAAHTNVMRVGHATASISVAIEIALNWIIARHKFMWDTVGLCRACSRLLEIRRLARSIDSLTFCQLVGSVWHLRNVSNCQLALARFWHGSIQLPTPIPTHNPSHSLTWLFHSRRPMPPWRCTPDPSCWVVRSVLRHHWSPRVARTTTSLSHPHSHRRHWCSSVRPLTARRQCHRIRSCCCSHWEAPQSWCCSACWGKPGYWLGVLTVPGLHASSMWTHWTCPCLRHQLSLLWCWCCREKETERETKREGKRKEVGNS